MEDSKSSDNNNVPEPQILLDFYIDLLDNSKNLLKYYLSDDAVLDWFGQTVKGQKNISTFIKAKVMPIKHIFHEAKAVSKIGFRDSHQIMLKPSRRVLRSAFLSPPRPSLLNTPKKQPEPSTSVRRQINRPNLDDCQPLNNNNKSPSNASKDILESPRKRRKFTSTRA